MNEQALNGFGSQEVLIDILGKLLKVFFRESAFGFNDYDVVVFENLMNHYDPGWLGG